MTGLHNGHGAIRANAGTAPIALTDVTMTSTFHKAGYKVGGFGKWGLGDKDTSGDPMKHGFDEFTGYYHQVHAHSYYPDFLWDSGKHLALSNKEYSADVIAARSLEFVRKHKDQPFFLYACYTLPHAKFEPPNESPYEKEQWPEGAKKYAAMVTRADTHIGNLLHLLDDLKLASNTIVYVTSDNGAPAGGGGEDKGFELFQSNGILRGQKGQFYEGGIRIPMMV